MPVPMVEQSNVTNSSMGLSPCALITFTLDVNSYPECMLWKDDVPALGHPLLASLSFLSVFFNSFIIFVIAQMMRQKQTQAQMHLLLLAFSDISVGLAYIFGAMWSWSHDANGDTIYFLRSFQMFRACQNILFWTNRSMITYIAGTRALAVSSTQNALESQNKTPKWVLIETLVFGVFGGVLFQLIVLPLGFLIAFHLLICLFFFANVFIVASLSIFFFFAPTVHRQKFFGTIAQRVESI